MVEIQYKLFSTLNKCVGQVTTMHRYGAGLDTNKSRISNCIITIITFIIFTDLSVPLSLISYLSEGEKSCISFLVGALTNYHNLKDLKQHKFILLKVWRSEVQNKSFRAEIKV